MEESKTSVERCPVKFIDLFSLSDREHEGLAKRIENNSGNIRILVHPFFRGPGDIDIVLGGEINRLRKIQKAIKRLASSNSTQTPPLLFMEEFQRVGRLKTRLLNSAKGEIYFIKTAPHSPRPIYSPDFQPEIPSKEESLVRDHRNWRPLIDLLNSLGVKRIIVSGENLLVEEEYDDPEMHNSEWPFLSGRIRLGQCVGATIKELGKYFPITLSCLSFPDSRKELIAAEKRLKEYYGEGVEIRLG
jgi:hypothetical protein